MSLNTNVLNTDNPSLLKKPKLRLKQKKFISEYLFDLNATQAAIRAGYSKRSAMTIGGSNMRKEAIKLEIERKLAEIEQKRIQQSSVSKDYVIGGLKEVAERCLSRVPVMIFDNEQRKMVQKTEFVEDPTTGELKEVGVWEFDSSGANKSLELLGKTFGLFTDKLVVTDSMEKMISGSVEVVDVQEVKK